MRRKMYPTLAAALMLAAALLAMLSDDLRTRVISSRWLVAGGGAIVLAVLLINYTMDRRLLRQLREFKETADRCRPPNMPEDGGDQIESVQRELDRMSATLKRIQDEYRTSLDEQSDLICRYNGDGRLVFVNASYARYFGCERDELVGRPFPLFSIALGARGRMVGDAPDTTTFEAPLESKTGATLWFAWTQRPVRSRNGEVIEFQAVGRDISLRREAEATLLRAKQTADGALRAKNEFLATASHELRAPINSIKGFADLLSGTILNHEQREQLSVIQGAAMTLDTLISEMLDLSEMEESKLHITRQPFALYNCIEDICSKYAQKAAFAAIKLDARIEPDVPAVIIGDHFRFGQVLAHLIDNAVRFTNRGSVSIHVACVKSQTAAGAEDGRLRLLVTVADTGIGIPAEQLATLFEQTVPEGAPAARHKQPGLGLVICRRLCELMDGAISAESQVGEGSIFRFSIQADHERTTATPFGSTPSLHGAG